MLIGEWLLPSAVIFFKFVIKTFVDHRPNVSDLIAGVLALPVDIVFLGSSFITAVIILDSQNAKLGLGIFAISIIIAVISVILWKRSVYCFEKNKIIGTFSLFLINITVSVLLTIYGVHSISQGSFE